MSLPGLSLPGSEHGVVWHALAGRVPGSRAGQDRLAKTVGARKFLSPARSVDRPVLQAASSSIVQTLDQSPPGCRSVDRPVRQAAGPPGSQSASRSSSPPASRASSSADRPAHSRPSSTVGRPVTRPAGNGSPRPFPAGRVSQAHDNHVYDRYSQENTNRAQKKLHIALRSIRGGRLGSCPTPPRSRARPPAALRPRLAGPSRVNAGRPAPQAKLGALGGGEEARRGGEGGLPASAGAWLANGSAPPDRERERPLAGALLPRRAALADSRRGAANRHARARGGRPRAPDQRTTRPLGQGPWAYGPMTQGPMTQGPAAEAALFALALGPPPGPHPGRALGPRAETERLSERSSASLWALDSWPEPARACARRGAGWGPRRLPATITQLPPS